MTEFEAMNHCYNAWNPAGKTPPDLPKGMYDAILRSSYPPGSSDTSPAKIEKVLKEVYAVRGDPSREHTLVFYGTPDEFAFFKARLCEWAKKRILT